MTVILGLFPGLFLASVASAAQAIGVAIPVH
jgi:hypothetical protein